MDIPQLITYIGIFIGGLAVGIPSAKKILENLIKAAESKAEKAKLEAEKAKIESEKAKNSSQAAGELAISAQSLALGNAGQLKDLWPIVGTLREFTEKLQSDDAERDRKLHDAQSLYTQAVTRMLDERKVCDEKILLLTERSEESERRHAERDAKDAERDKWQQDTDLYIAALHEQLNALGQQPVPRARRKATKDLESVKGEI